MTARAHSPLAALALVVALTGCANHYPAHDVGATRRPQPPLVEVPRVSGSSHGNTAQARAATTVGNHQTPALLRINARASRNSLELAPVLQSRYLNWRF